MRILHLDASLDERGGQTQLLLLAARWGGRCELLVAVRADAPLRARLERAGVPVALYAPSWRQRSLAQIAARFGPTLLAAHDRDATVEAARLGLPFVVHRRVDFVPSPWGYRRYQKARGVIAVSEAVAAVMRRGGVERVAVVRDGVPPSEPSGSSEPWSRAEVRAMLGLPAEVPLVMAAGALVEHKGHRVLLEALALLPGVHLVLAGRGPLEGRLRAQASTLGISRRVHLVGFRDDLPRWLPSVDAFVHPSLEEGLGQVVIEALLAGVPLVYSQAGGLRELEVGLPFAPADAAGLARALQQTLAPQGAHPRAIGHSEALVARFGVDRMIEETFAAYQRFGC